MYPNPSTTGKLPVSGSGIASLGLFIFALLMVVMLIMTILSVQSSSNPDPFIHDSLISISITGLQLRPNTIIVIAVGGAIAGLGLGVAGVRQKHRRRTIAVCGIIANSLFLGIIAVIVGLST